jgi:hypothetical protein
MGERERGYWWWLLSFDRETARKERKRTSFDDRCAIIVYPQNQTRLESHLYMYTWQLTWLTHREVMGFYYYCCSCPSCPTLFVLHSFSITSSLIIKAYYHHSCYFVSFAPLLNWQLSRRGDEMRRKKKRFCRIVIHMYFIQRGIEL